MLLLVTTVALFVGLGWVGYGAARGRGVVVTLGTALAVTLLALALGRAGVFAVFDTVPPRFALFVVGVTLALQIALGRSGALALVPLPRLIALQSFRLLVELALYQLAREGRLPLAMTFAGRNFDVVVALSAPFVAWLVHRRGARVRGLVLAWNVASLLLLANVVVRGFGSLPGPTHLFDGIAPVALARDPWVLVPGLFVVTAFGSHLVIFRRLLGKAPIADAPRIVQRS